VILRLSADKYNPMKYLILSVLAYWIYHRFFAIPLNNNSQHQQGRPHSHTPPPDARQTPKKDVGEFIDYEEVE
jgi:hypothetical protein